MPAETDVADLPADVRAALRQLSVPAARIAGEQLAAAALLIDTDPAGALQHARAARDVAGRIGVVREAVGVAAYHAGEFAEARTELRAARRITGAPDTLALLADCERALGAPARALEVAAHPDADRLDEEDRVELAIVVSGARRDLGEPDAALAALSVIPEPDSARPWAARLWYARAEALLAAGRVDDAARQFAAAAAVDDGSTDATERAAALGA